MTSRVGEYLLQETLGTGAFGNVRRAVHQQTGKQYAIKIMEKALIRNQELTLNVRREIAIMKAFNHPNIVSVRTVLTSNTKLYVVLDLVQGLELFEIISNRGTGGLPERHARKYFHDLIDGVDYCHRRGVCHRDLKPENLLVDCDGTLKITDFGLSSMKGANTTTDLLTTQCGTPNYIAPEIISCKNPLYDGQKVDTWACGIILFALLAGYLPFDETHIVHLFEVIQRGHIDFPNWFSAGARDLICRLLCVDPATRASVQDIKRHPWFLVDYHSSPRTGTLSSTNRQRRRRSRAEKTLGEDGLMGLSVHDQQNRNPGIPVLTMEKFSVPQLNEMVLDLPNLELPINKPISMSKEKQLDLSQTAAAAAQTTRVEMLRSRRELSFSKKYSLLRKGTVNYGGLEIGVSSFCGPTTLGGEQEARLRGVLSKCSLSASTKLNLIFANDGKGTTDTNSEILRDRNALSLWDATNGQQRTVEAIRSLRSVISTTRTMLRVNNTDDDSEEDEIRETTLKSVRNLRHELKAVESSPSTYESGQDFNSQSSWVMSPVQRRDAIRLLDVWESRIFHDLQGTKGSEDTRVTEEEIYAFQVLLQTWETHLAGEDVVEDVFIPGSEAVEDESPAPIVPERFLGTCHFLRHVECRRKGNEVDDNERLGKCSDRSTPSHTCLGAEFDASPHSIPSQMSFIEAESTYTPTLATEKSDDLTKLWNHVLVANTSKLDVPQENASSPHVGSSLQMSALMDGTSSSTVTEAHPSPQVISIDALGEIENNKSNMQSKKSSDHPSEIPVQPCNLQPLCQSHSAGGSGCSLKIPASHSVRRTSNDRQQLQYVKSQDFETEPPLVRTHAQLQIRVDSIASCDEAIATSMRKLATQIQGKRDARSGFLRARIDQRKRSEDSFDLLDSLHPVTRKHKFLHMRSRFRAQFESGYDPRTCLRELGRLMVKEGLDVSRKHGHDTLRVRVPGSQGKHELTTSFEFFSRGQKGSLVQFKRISGDRSMTRSEEEAALRFFLTEILHRFSVSEPGLAVLSAGM